MTEKELVNQIIELLNYTGRCFVWRTNSGVMPAEYKGKKRMIRMAAAGTSDILGIRKSDGRMLCMEVKLPTTKKTLTTLQQEYLLKMREYGAITGMVTCGEEAIALLEGEWNATAFLHIPTKGSLTNL